MWIKRWLDKLEGHDPASVARALKAVSETPTGTPIPKDAADHALAASELVAAALGKPHPSLPPQALALAASLRPKVFELQRDAQAAVERIRQRGENPDPHDRWDEPDAATDAANADARDWREQMDLLALRLAD